jgi:hypothetical protein
VTHDELYTLHVKRIAFILLLDHLYIVRDDNPHMSSILLEKTGVLNYTLLESTNFPRVVILGKHPKTLRKEFPKELS